MKHAVCGLLFFSLGMSFDAFGEPFSYQGQLSVGVVDRQPAQGLYDLQVKLFKTPVGGAATGATNFKEDVDIVGGIFSTQLDFGEGVFDGSEFYLELSVREGASTGAYTTLAPRARIGATP